VHLIWQVLGLQTHRHQEYLHFFKPVDFIWWSMTTPYKHPKVKRWRATHSRYQVRYTPNYVFWLNQAEIWFNLITQKAIRRGP
jgi:hypothetical protein